MRRLLAVVLTSVLVCACVAASFGSDPARAAGEHTLVADQVGSDVSGRVVVHVPPNPTRTGVVVLASYGHLYDEPIGQGWSDAADRHGFLAIYPSRDGSWNAGVCCGRGAATNRDDVAWLAARIAEVRDRYGLTTVYLAGFSNGGMMAERLVAERPLSATRLATWGATPAMPQPGRWTGVGILYTGEFDDRVPVVGGTTTIAGRRTTLRPATSTNAWLLDADLQHVIVTGAAHEPPRGWPELAWRALTAPVGLAPTSTADGPSSSVPRAVAPLG
jgi:polyhydroxybutyrate depolymerase